MRVSVNLPFSRTFSSVFRDIDGSSVSLRYIFFLFFTLKFTQSQVQDVFLKMQNRQHRQFNKQVGPESERCGRVRPTLCGGRGGSVFKLAVIS